MHSADPDLARRLEAIDGASNLEYVITKARLEPESGAASMRIGDGIALYAGRGSPISRVHGLGMARPVSEDTVEMVESFYAARGEDARIDLCPLAAPSLMDVLGKRAYCVTTFKHVFWRTLDRIPDWPERPDNVRIEPVTAATARLWAQIVAAGFSGGMELADGDITLPRFTPFKAHGCCFLAWIDDTPVGGAALSMDGGSAICYSACVRPPFRRMGVQTALLAERLNVARAEGCDLAVVQTTPGSASQHNVERFGFRLAYTKPTVARPITLHK